MPFIDTTLVTAQITNQLPKIAAQVSSEASTTSTNNVKNFISSITRNTVNPLNDVTGIGSVGAQIFSSLGSGISTNRLKQDAVNFANSQLGSVNNTLRTITNTFGGTTTLASSISSLLGGIFDNKNNPLSSNRTTLISDPVTTNILRSVPPRSSAFRVSSSGLGSSDNNSIFGSRDLQMIGTIASTLLNRFDLDSTSTLARSLLNSFGTNRVNGLFPSSVSGGLSQLNSISNIVTNRQRLGTINNTTSQVISTVSSVFNIFNQSQTQTRNDFGNFISRASNLSNSLGGVDVSSYYTKNPTYSLINEQNNYVDTKKSGVDVQTANSIRALLPIAGVQNVEGSYDSAHEQASAFNIGLIAASVNGMTDEVDKLTNLPFKSSSNGQQSIINAFTAVSNSNLSMASTLLESVDQPNQLDKNNLTKSILTNKKLKSTDISSLNNVLTILGTNFSQSISLSKASTSKYPVIDASFVTNINSNIVDSYLNDKSISNYFDGITMSVDKTGRLTV